MPQPITQIGDKVQTGGRGRGSDETEKPHRQITEGEQKKPKGKVFPAMKEDRDACNLPGPQETWVNLVEDIQDWDRPHGQGSKRKTWVDELAQ